MGKGEGRGRGEQPLAPPMSDGPQIGSYDPKNLAWKVEQMGRETTHSAHRSSFGTASLSICRLRYHWPRHHRPRDGVSTWLSASIARTPLGVSITDLQADYPYINGICSQNLPRTEIFPVFIIVHGILLLIPHYLWLNHYEGSFDFFFSQTSQLDRLRSEDTGEYLGKNRLILQHLTAAFSTYKQNWMYVLHVCALDCRLLHLQTELDVCAVCAQTRFPVIHFSHWLLCSCV